MAPKGSNHRFHGIIKDIEALERTGDSSFEISVSLTTSIMQLTVDRIKAENPDVTDIEILHKTREQIFHGRTTF